MVMLYFPFLFYALDDPEDDGLCGRLASMDEQLGHRLGDSRMGFLAEGVI